MPSHLPPEVRKRLALALRGTLRTARTSAALTQGQMAGQLGLGLSAYKRLENGLLSPGVETLRKLRRVLCLSLDALLGPECARAVERASRPPRRKRPARSASPRARTASRGQPAPLEHLPPRPRVYPYPLASQDPWGLLAATPWLPGASVLPLLLVRRGTPLALVVDVG